MARAAFRKGDPDLMARAAGAAWNERNRELVIVCLGRHYRVEATGVVADEDGRQAGFNIATLVLQYLASTAGLPPHRRWLAFLELPEGALHHVPFVEIVEKPLARAYAGRGKSLAQAGRRLGGTPLDLGDHSFVVEALPRLPLAVVFRDEDEEFCAQVSILFDAAAPASLPTASLWMLGQELARALIGIS